MYRTPSPQIRIRRSQSFGSPSSRLTISPSPLSTFSKSASAIIKPHSNPSSKSLHPGIIRHVGNKVVLLHTRFSAESMSTGSDAESESSSVESSPVAQDEDGDSRMTFFHDTSAPPSPTSSSSAPLTSAPPAAPSPPPASFNTSPVPSATSSSSTYYSSSENEDANDVLAYQIAPEELQPVWDPWLVRVVLDMFDVRGLDWMGIAGPIEREWGVQTSSAVVLGILQGNGRIRGGVWWD